MTASRSLQLSHSIRVSRPPSSPPRAGRRPRGGCGRPALRAAGCASPRPPPSRTPVPGGRTPRAAGRCSREPSGNLDHANSDRLHEVFFRLAREYETAVVVVTHNRQLAGRADRILLLDDGRLAAGSPVG